MTVQPYQAVPDVYNGQVSPEARKQLYGISSLIHGIQKAGKSSLADSCGPDFRPTLILDVETASQWTPSRKLIWNPVLTPDPPTWPSDPRAASPYNPQGLWDTCVVHVHDYQLLYRTWEILNYGRHPFNSVSIDSVASIQHRVMNSKPAGMERKDWGELLRLTTGLIWQYRDLLTHPVRQVWAVTFVCPTHLDDKTRKMRPQLYGQSSNFIPYVPDLEGWVYTAPDGTHRMWIGPSDYYETGNRLWGRLPDEMVLGYPGVSEGWTIEHMVKRVLETQ